MSKTKKRAMIESDSDDLGSSDLEQELKAQAKRAKPTPVSTTAHSSSSGSSSGSDDEWTIDEKKGGEREKKKVVKGGRGPVGKRMPAGRKMLAHRSMSESSHEEEEEEEDTVEDGARETQGASSESGESSSSDSDSSSDESIQFDDGLDDDLVGDEEDRNKLSNMTDVEREQEMYLRYERRQAQKTRFEIEQKLRRERRVKKRKAREQAEREQNRLVRSSRRSRLEDSSKSKAMDELKAKRSADKQKREEQQQQAASTTVVKEPLNAAEVYSSNSEQESSSSSGSESEGGDSDDETGGKSQAGVDSIPISSVEEITKIKLSRFRLEKWVHMPFFKDVAIGCFVRVGIGAHEGRMVYRVCEITDVIETPKVYSLGPTKTNKCLRLSHGHQERSFRMEYVSNSPFSEAEFSKWKKELEQRGYPLPTVDFIRRKSKRIEQAKTFQFKEEDIEKIIEEKRKFRKAPTNYAMTKSRLLREKELAEEDGDSEQVSILTQTLSELEEKAEQLDKQRSKGLSAISYINERNRQRNVSRAEQALKEEMADDKRKKDDDPFTRRRCKPTLVTLTKEVTAMDGQGAGQLLQKYSQATTEEDKHAIKASLREAAPQILSPTTPNNQKTGSLNTTFGQATPNVSLLSSTPVPPTTSSASSEDLFSAHDFDIHIDLPSTPEGTGTVKTLNKSAVVATPRTDEAPKRSLNLADYKKRRGLI